MEGRKLKIEIYDIYSCNTSDNLIHPRAFFHEGFGDSQRNHEVDSNTETQGKHSVL